MRRVTPVALATACGVVGALAMASPAAAMDAGSGAVTDPTSMFGGWAIERLFDQLDRWVSDGLSAAVAGLSSAMSTSTTTDPTAVWFSGPGSPYAAIRSAAAAVALLMVLAAIVAGVASADPAGVARRVLVGVPAAALATAAVTVVTTRALALTDALAAWVLAPVAGSGPKLVDLFATSSVLTNGAAGVVIAMIALLAAIGVWVELLIRSALIAILVALSPLSFAAAVFPPARAAGRRICELLVAVVLSKLVIAVAFAVGIAALGTNGGDGLGPLMVGTTVLVLAAFAPFLVLRLFPLAEAATAGQGAAGMPMRAAHTTLAVAATAASVGHAASAGGSASVSRLAGGSRG